MRRTLSYVLGLAWLLFILAANATAADSKDEALKKERMLLAGTWRISSLEVNGNQAMEEDARKLTVTNGPDNQWVLSSEGKEIARGTNVLDPTVTPKAIELTVKGENGQESRHLGIYELGENIRKLCFAPPGKDRPTEFASSAGSEHILVVFERVESK